MKRFTYILLTLVLVSCGTRHGQFKIEGRFLNLNQGEFYVYSPDGLIKGIDTIKVDGGHFTYQTACQEEGVLMLVFPNFSEQPIFAESGSSVNIKADASHLKELTVEGTKNNELMTTFRQQIVKSSPPRNGTSGRNFHQRPQRILRKRLFTQTIFHTKHKAGFQQGCRIGIYPGIVTT